MLEYQFSSRFWQHVVSVTRVHARLKTDQDCHLSWRIESHPHLSFVYHLSLSEMILGGLILALVCCRITNAIENDNMDYLAERISVKDEMMMEDKELALAHIEMDIKDLETFLQTIQQPWINNDRRYLKLDFEKWVTGLTEIRYSKYVPPEGGVGGVREWISNRVQVAQDEAEKTRRNKQAAEELVQALRLRMD